MLTASKYELMLAGIFRDVATVVEVGDQGAEFVTRIPETFEVTPKQTAAGIWLASLNPIVVRGNSREQNYRDLFNLIYDPRKMGVLGDEVTRVLYRTCHRPGHKHHVIEPGRFYEQVDGGSRKHNHNDDEMADFTFVKINPMTCETEFTEFENGHTHLHVGAPASTRA